MNLSRSALSNRPVFMIEWNGELLDGDLLSVLSNTVALESLKCGQYYWGTEPKFSLILMNLCLDSHMWPVALCPSPECILRKEKYSMPLTSTGGEEMHSSDGYFLEALTSCSVFVIWNTLHPERAQRRWTSLRGVLWPCEQGTPSGSEMGTTSS